MELDAFKAEGAVEGEFLLVGEGLTDLATERVATLADVPGAERESIRDRGGSWGGLEDTKAGVMFKGERGELRPYGFWPMSF